MKNLIRITLFVLAVATVIGVCLGVSAETPIEIKVEVDNDTIYSGDTVTATVYLTASDVTAFAFSPLCISENLEAVSAKWVDGLDADFKVDWTPEEYAVITFGSENAKDFVNEAVARMTFKVDGNADIGEVLEIGCTEVVVAIVDRNGDEIIYNADEVGGVISIEPFVGKIACDHRDSVEVNETPATCTQTGYTAGVYCNYCEIYVSGHEVTPALEHTFTVVVSDENGHWFKCANCPEVTVSVEHTWDDGVVTTEPTVSSEGVKTYTCTLEGCGQTKTESVASLALYGDVNGDGKVNVKDSAFLARYLTKWTGYDNTTIVFVNADVNSDGKVNAKDAVILARHLVLWTGYDTLPYVE